MPLALMMSLHRGRYTNMKTKNWDGFRKQHQSIIKNLLNNVDICNRRYVEEGEGGYLVQRDVYIKEIEELKTFIKEKELELGYYREEDN